MHVEYTSIIDHPLDAVAAWHQHPGALVRMCPPGLGGVLDASLAGIRDGHRVRAQIGPPQLGDGLRPGWTLEHSDVVEAASFFGFTDSQVHGPFRSWHHRHEMETVRDGTATRLHESIDLELPRVAAIGSRVAADKVRRMLVFRAEQLQEDLDLHARFNEHPRLTVAVAGASGLIGTQLTALLRTGGHRVVPLVRGRAAREGEIFWDPGAGELDVSDLESVDAVVDLSGRSIATRMTQRAKREIISSRVASTRLLSEATARLAAHGTGPRSVVQASAIGYYGAQRPGEMLREDSPPGDDFLARVCRAWEAANSAAEDAGLRTCELRTGIVLTDAGGALAPQLPLFLAGLGGPLTRRDAALSWITLDDIVRCYAHALLTPSLQGPVNAVAPHPTTAGDFARSLGRILHRPSAVPVPPQGPRLLLGREGSRLIVETDQLVADDRLRTSGFAAAHDDVDSALRHIVRRPPPAT